MKTIASLALLGLLLAVSNAFAATGTWTATTGSPASWGLATNWSGSTIADGATFTANITANITSGYTINLDTSRTIGTVIIGDSTTGSAYTIATGANTLTFDNGASNAALTQNGNGQSDIVSGKLAIGGNGTLVIGGSRGFSSFTVSAGITSALSSGTQTLNIANSNVSHTTILSGIIGDGVAGGKIALSKTSSGVATLSNANTYSGGTSLSGGTLNINNANAIGSGALTLTGGTLNNTTASAITLATNNAQNWNGNFAFGGTRALNLGTGAVTLGANVTTTVGGNSSSALTVGGDISGTGFGLTKAGFGTLILTGTNSYDGGTTINGGVLQFNTTGSISGTGQNVAVNDGGAAAFGFALDQATLTGRLVSGSAGTVALAADSSNNLDFGAAGLANLSLGAAGGPWTYSGSLWTPSDSIYRLGGGGGTLVFNPALSGSNSLIVGGNNSGGTVTLVNAGTYSGPTTVTGGTGSATVGSVNGASLLQTNVLAGSSTTPFGSNSSITLNNGAIGLGTAGALGAGEVMNVTGYDVTYSGTNAINFAVGGGASVTFAANSLNRANNGVLIINPTSGSTLGSTEIFKVATGAPVVANGMVAPHYIDGTTKNFLTYNSTDGFKDVTYTQTITVSGTTSLAGLSGSDIALINNSGNNATFSGIGNLAVNALKMSNSQTFNGTMTFGTSADTLSILSGGLIMNWAGNGGSFSGATFNFGTNEAVVGAFSPSGTQTFSNLLIGSGGFTTYGNQSITVGNLQTTGGINIAGGSTLLVSANGAISFNPNNVLTVDRGGTFGSNANNRPAQVLGLSGEGSVNWSSSTGGNNAGTNTYTIDGLTGTSTNTFSGVIQDASGYTLNIVKSGLNTQVLSGANNYTGTTTINGGILRLDFSGSNAPSTNILNNATNASSLILGGGKLDIVGAAGATNSQQFNGLTVGSGNSTIALTAGSGGGVPTVALGGSGAFSRSAGGTIDFVYASGTPVSTTATTNLTGGIWTKDATTTTAFATVNGTDWATVSSGTISALSSYSTGAANYLTGNNIDVGASDTPSAAFTVNSLRFNSGTKALTLNGSSNNTISTGGILVTAGTTASISAGNLVTANAAGNEFVIINNGQLTLDAVLVNNSNATGLTLSGTGTTTLNGVNTIQGPVWLNSGTLVMGTGSTISSTGTLQLNGGTLAFNSGGAIGATKPINLANNSTIGGTNDVTLGGAFTNGRNYNTLTISNTANTTLSGTFSIGNGNVLNIAGSGNLTVSGVVSTTGGLNYAGTGIMTLSNASSSYSGVTKVSSGTLSVGTLANGAANSSIGAATNVASNIVLDGGTLKYTGATVSTDRLFSVGGSGGTLDASGSGAVTFSNAGSIGFANTPGTRTLTLTGTNTDANTLTPIVSDHLGLYATSLTKSGAGKWVLAGANTYSGATTITAGTLVLASGGTIAGTSGVNLGTSGSQGTLDLTAKSSGFSLGTAQTLTGYGNVIMASGQTLTVNGGLAPGNSPGVIAISGNLALTSTSTTTMDLIDNTLAAGIGFDQITLSGVTPTLTYDGTLTLNVTLATKPGVYHLFTGFNSQSGTFTGGINYSLVGAAGTFDYATGDLNLTAVPEPATWGLLAFSLTTILVLRRRKS